MTDSDRDPSYYEILNVARDASPEAVRMAYRRRMQQAGGHPDRGGDAKTAALINKAYAVLSDPAGRSEYDLRLDILARVTQGIAIDRDAPGAAGPARRVLDPSRECVFCAAAHDHGAVRDLDLSCDTCGSPLAAARTLRIEPAGQRAVERIGRQLDVTYFTHWQQARGQHAKTEDISLNGLRLVTRHDVEPGQRIRLVSGLLEAVGNVTNCTTRQGLLTRHTVAGVAFVTLRFTRSVGGFVSRRV
jgi:hypothetical protein